MMDDGASATRLKELLIEVSPLIEEYTARVCPDCREVCCKQRFGIMNAQDRQYTAALDEFLPDHDPLRPLDGPCQFMGPRGCLKPRWLRPWRCTSYFCAPLLAAMEQGPQKKPRRISAILQQLVDIRRGWDAAAP